MVQTFPLGTSDFKLLRRDKSLYVDKTQTISLMESDSRYITFLRPRRFGKSLFVSTLFYYYDLNSKSIFQELFGDLHIGKHSTDEKNSYYMLKFNFSELEFSKPSEIPIIFKAMVIERLREFIEYYTPKEKHHDLIKVLKLSNPLNTILRRTLHDVAGFEGKVYVLIDEYDHFSNRMIFSGLGGEYMNAVQGSSFIRQFFTTLKALTEGPVKRIFITGILPILINDITSGFNISKSVSKDISYQGAMGFTSKDVKKLLENLDLMSDEIFSRIEYLYDGFMFADTHTQTTPKVYNSQMVLSYIDSYSTSKIIPADIINSTFLSDKNKFEFLKQNPRNLDIVMDILDSPTFASNYKQVLNLNELFDSKNLATILFHFGLLTFEKYSSTLVIYKIPNRAMKELYYEYFKEFIQEKSSSFENIQKILSITTSLSQNGDIAPLISFLQNDVLASFSFRDAIKLNEQSLKFLLLMFFKFTPFYEIRSEQELTSSQNQGGYGDLTLIESKQNNYSEHQKVKYEWLFELKYIKKSAILFDRMTLDNYCTQDKLLQIPSVKKAVDSASLQLKRYKEIYKKHHLNPKSALTMKYVSLVFIGKEFIVYREVD